MRKIINMDESLHKIDEIFYEPLNEYEEEPFGSAWNALEKRLDQETINRIKKKYTVLKRAFILLFLLLLSISIYEGQKLLKFNSQAKNNNKVDHSIASTIRSKTLEEQKEMSREKSVEPVESSTVVKEQIIGQVSSVKVKTKSRKVNLEKGYQMKHLGAKYIGQDFISNYKSQKTFQVINTKRKYNYTHKPFGHINKKGELLNNDSYNSLMHSSIALVRQIPSLESIPNSSVENKMLHMDDSIGTKISLHPNLIYISGPSNTHSVIAINKKKKLSRFSFSLSFSPDIAWYRLKKSTSNSNVNNQSMNLSQIESEEKQDFSYTYGAAVNYNLNGKWGLQTGINLSVTNIKILRETIYAQPDNSGKIKYRLNSSLGYGFVLPQFNTNPQIGDSLTAISASNSLEYLEIPLALTFNHPWHKFEFKAFIGASANFRLRTTLNTTLEKGIEYSVETVQNMNGPKNVYLSGLTGLGFSFKINKSIALSFAPVVRFAIDPINRDGIAKSYPISISSAIGLNFKL